MPCSKTTRGTVTIETENVSPISDPTGALRSLQPHRGASQSPTSNLQDDAVSVDPLPPGYEDYAGEVLVANGKPPRWMTRVPYLSIILSLAYYAWVRAFDPVNLVFAVLLIIWMIYTPIAQKRGWFFIPM